MVLPLLITIILLIIGVALVYTVRTAEHKLAYDAARHVAKDSTLDLITGCGTDLKPAYAGSAQAVVDYYYTGDHANHFLQAMTENVQVVAITTGPQVTKGPHSQPDAYYCNQAVEVTVTYDIKVPAWDVVKNLLNSNGTTSAQETGVAARLAKDYEDVTCDQQPQGAPGC